MIRRPTRRSFDDWKLLVAVAAAQLAVGMALRVTSIANIRHVMARLAQIVAGARAGTRHVPPASVDTDVGSEQRVVRAIDATGRRLGPLSTCLVRALVAEMCLWRDGLVLTIGVRRSAVGEFESHAWLSRGARVVVGAPIDGYVPMVTWMGDRA